MSFLSDLFKRKPKEPEPPRTRQEMESDLTVQYDSTLQVQTTNGVLNQVFKQTRRPQEEEQKLLTEMLDIIASVPQGQQLLDDVAKSGYDIFFETARGANDGCMYADQKKIMLCPCQHTSVAGLAATAFHEMTHAVQNERSNGKLGTNCAQLNMADQFKFQRAAEAAAWTEEAKFAYQIKDRYPEVEQHVAAFPMYRAFSEEMKASGSMEKAGEAAFKSWYGYKHYQNVYEENHVSNITYFMRQNYACYKDILSKSISSEQVLNDVFLSDDVKKNISPEFLTSKEAFSVSENAVSQLNKAGFAYSRGKKDPSLGSMYSYETGLMHSESKENAETKEAVAASVRPQKQSSIMSELKRIDTAAKIKQTAAIQAGRSAQH